MPIIKYTFIDDDRQHLYVLTPRKVTGYWVPHTRFDGSSSAVDLSPRDQKVVSWSPIACLEKTVNRASRVATGVDT
jgi:hypothetical protein